LQNFGTFSPDILNVARLIHPSGHWQNFSLLLIKDRIDNLILNFLQILSKKLEKFHQKNVQK
jgi:hypothetical protein